MSYCRFGEGSDVYVYTDGAHIYCCGCRLGEVRDAEGDGVDASFVTPAEMLAHLERHRAVGDMVPQHAMDRLVREAAGERVKTDVMAALEELQDDHRDDQG